jgi:predicted secreted Zn-dependent protease
VKRFAWLALLPLIACADEKNLRVDYYDIGGERARELRADLDRRGPVDDTGKRSDAYTRWHIAWRYDFDSSAGGCSAGNYRVDLTVTMTMPRWSPTPKASPALRDLWARYLSALQRHEDGHYDLAIAAAEDVRRSLGAVGRESGCDLLRSRLDSAANAVLDAYRRKEQDYDRETDSGRRQGTNVL